MSNPTRIATPTKPTASPASRLTVIASPARNSDAMTITSSGTAELMTAASDDVTCCSANVIRANGIAMLITPMTNRWPYIRGSRGSISPASRTTVASRTNPIASRSMIKVKGVSPWSTPILMKR